MTRFDAADFRTNFAAEVKSFSLRDHLDTWRKHETAGLGTQFALAAAAQAWRQSGLDRQGVSNRRLGIYLGAGEGSLDHGNFFKTNLAGWNESTRTVDAGEVGEGGVREHGGGPGDRAGAVSRG